MTALHRSDHYNVDISTGILEEYGSRGSSVGIETDYRLKDQGVRVRVPIGARIFSFPSCPDWLWDSPNFLYNGYRWLVLRDKPAEA
jgi:hypothetical protein